MLPLEARCHHPLDRTLIISILSLPEACHRLTNLIVSISSPMTNLVISILSPSTYPWMISLFLNLPLSFPQLSITLSSSLSLTKFFSLMNGLVLIFVSLSIFIEVFYYKMCLEVEKMVEKMWETSSKIAFLECNQTSENIFQNNF